MFKNVASQKIQLFAFDITTGAPKTGDAANLTAYVSKDHGSVTVLGDTSAAEMDATNAPGVYLFDLTQTETNADELTFTAKSSTANVSITPRFISTTPPNFTLQSIDSNGRVDVIKIAGTTQTAGDIFARLGAPAGASMSADIAAVKADTAATLIDTAEIGLTALATQSSVDTIDANVDAILLDTGTDGVVVASASKTGYRLSSTGVDDVLDEVVEGTTTLRQSVRLANAALGSKASGLAGTTAVYRDIGDTKDRITATVDADGNRTAVTTDLT